MTDQLLPTRQHLPIILIRGFGGLSPDEERQATYQGFNEGSVYPLRRGENYIYEDFILKLIKADYAYADATNVIAYFAQEAPEPTEQSLQGFSEDWKAFFRGDRIVADPDLTREMRRHPDRTAKTFWVFRYYDLEERTDAAFYLAGTVVTIGVATSVQLTRVPWGSGAEILGLLVFTLIFLWLGRRWAERQKALDRVGAPFASRLAVFERALHVAPWAGTTCAEASQRPLTALLEFVVGKLAHKGRELDPLVIFGAIDSGKTPRGPAIASEAALADLSLSPVLPFGHQTGLVENPRSARYVTERNLLAESNRATAATRPEASEDNLTPLCAGGGRPAASLVVIDQLILGEGLDLPRLLGQLSRGERQQTVWLIKTMVTDFDADAGQAWRPEPNLEMRRFLAGLEGLLGGGGIAVAFVARRGEPQVARVDARKILMSSGGRENVA